MPVYIANLKIELDATSPEAAAEQAFNALGDIQGNSRVIFEVAEVDDEGVEGDAVAVVVTEGVAR